MLTEFFTMNETNKRAKELQLLYIEFPEHFVWSVSDKMWSPRQQGYAIGRIVTCHPTEGERYYFRLLLMNIRGPKSYKDLKTVNGKHCSTFRESAEKRGLLACDNNLIDYMFEAANYQMPYSLRRLFATLLVYCNPANPRDLWERFESSMSEDFSIIPNIQTNNIRKSFLYRALLATVRSRGFIALATTTSGVAAFVLPGGRTAHSRFKLPIDTTENYNCNISKQSSLASLIRDAKLIVWDEVSMAKKKLVETFDLLLRDIMDKDTLFGGKVVVFREKVNEHGKIEVPKSFLIPFTNEKESLHVLFKTSYPNLDALIYDTSSVTSRAILTTKNDFVNEINQMFIDQFPKTAMTFIGIDETVEPKDQSQFEDFLHTLNPAGLPPYKLVLKKNCPI
ncbi:uncharacterized protein [Nicotiana sylvestris]|uniref:uncharacterized protein n=1 Tax=Nicotiana sylvestris TaxID=4096 RepID=UPI00388CD631